MSAQPWIFNHCRVMNVVDGDTCDVEIDLGFLVVTKVRVRLYGIDTPERGQPGWAEATAALKEMVLNKKVQLISYKHGEKFGRFLGELYVDEINVNQELLVRGFAKVYE